jgi:ferredoxin--NADP+ reductase
MTENIKVAVIGAGPAGLFAAERLAALGYGVVLFNRDIKPGGMAEYGIYPDKQAVKDGLRRQFNLILANDQIHYYGNVNVGEDRPVTVPQILAWGVPALLVACGAQGTKWLGIPGEKLAGVYHAKDVVYHYNRLPPFSTMPINIGKHVVIVGAGNVMADVARYLISQQQVEEVHICIRRGPAEVKFTRKELATIIHAVDFDMLHAEIDRVAHVMRAVGQDPEQELDIFHSTASKEPPSPTNARILMHFLVSPSKVLDDGTGRMGSLLLEDNTLVGDAENTTARGLGSNWMLPADTVIFAIGDKVETKLGVPVLKNDYQHTLEPKFPIEGQSYEAADGSTGQPWAGVFLAGWSRIASNGLVGNAKKDGINAAAAIDQYLQTQNCTGIPLEELDGLLSRLVDPVVRKADLLRLVDNERARAETSDQESAKYLTNAEMLKVMGLG